MSNRQSICLGCVHRENCKLFNEDPEAEVIDCGRFLMKDTDKAIMQAIYELFNVPIDIPEVKEKLDEAEGSYWYFMKKNFGIDESELEDRPDFLRKHFNIPMDKEDMKVIDPSNLGRFDMRFINRGKCMLCGKELTEGLFFCKECETKVGGEDKNG